MKKFLTGLFFVTGSAFASVRVYNSSGVNLGDFSKISCGSAFSCSQSSGRMALSLSSLVGHKSNQIASTTTTLTSAQCGSTVVSDSADVVTLPEASTVLGCRYSFVCGTADDFDINPNDGTDQILPITASGGTISPAAGDAIRCTDAGAGVVLEAIGANAWAAISHNGSITDVN